MATSFFLSFFLVRGGCHILRSSASWISFSFSFRQLPFPGFVYPFRRIFAYRRMSALCLEHKVGIHTRVCRRQKRIPGYWCVCGLRVGGPLSDSAFCYYGMPLLEFGLHEGYRRREIRYTIIPFPLITCIPRTPHKWLWCRCHKSTQIVCLTYPPVWVLSCSSSQQNQLLEKCPFLFITFSPGVWGFLLLRF